MLLFFSLHTMYKRCIAFKPKFSDATATSKVVGLGSSMSNNTSIFDIETGKVWQPLWNVERENEWNGKRIER